MISELFSILLGGGRNRIAETIEVFRPNAEAAAIREAAQSAAALQQFAAEFQIERKGWFDRFIDGLNRLPRPMLALGTLGLFVVAMTNPVWFAQRMQGIALVPDPLWWLMGAIVSFYFGARHQAKSHDMQRSLAATLARTPEVVKHIDALGAFSKPGKEDEHVLEPSEPVVQTTHVDSRQNAALAEWKARHGK